MDVPPLPYFIPHILGLHSKALTNRIGRDRNHCVCRARHKKSLQFPIKASNVKYYFTHSDFATCPGVDTVALVGFRNR